MLIWSITDHLVLERRTTLTRTIREIEAELKEAQAIEDAELKARRDAVKLLWEYTMTPMETKLSDDFDPIYDPTISAYKLYGRVINREECLAAGHPEFLLGGGGMRYLFNKVTGRLIGPTGGGTIYIGLGFGRRNRGIKKLEKVITAISQFLVEHPEGGDISAIVGPFREAEEE